MLRTILAAAGAVVAWLAYAMLGHAIGEALRFINRPILRYVARVTREVRWPWPLFLAVLAGVLIAVGGLRLMSADGWRSTAGLGVFMAGVGGTLLSPLLWRDAKRQAMAGPTTQPVV